jgi:anti-sigma-K factor RskA
MTADQTNHTKLGEPSEIELLLPWYAAGTLDPDEMRQVEAALAGDPDLASRYEWVRTKFAQETAIGDSSGQPSPAAINTLFAKIDAMPARRSQPASGLSERIAEFLASLSPRALGWSALAAALAIVLQAAVLAGIAFHQKTPGGYQTASVPSAAPSDGSYVLIRFTPEATAADISTFLEANNLSIVGGPSGGHLYQVRIASQKLPNDELPHIIYRLKKDKVVGFIVPMP